LLELSINLVLNGLFYAGILFLMSAGLQIIFGVLRIVNFAHAGFYIMGIYFTYAIIIALPPEYFFLIWMAPLISAVLVGLLGLAFERGLLKHIYHRDHVFQILVTAGVVYIIDDLIRF
jgi:branched-subunit amino acid ABC-type transport system permease component